MRKTLIALSVMAGFAHTMRDRLHGILADVVVESYDLDGFRAFVASEGFGNVFDLPQDEYARLLTDEECVLTNVPRIGDVEVMARLLADLGAEVQGIGTTTLRIRSGAINTHAPDRGLVGRLRGVKVDAIYVSPLERCRETAAPLGDESAQPARAFAQGLGPRQQIRDVIVTGSGERALGVGHTQIGRASCRERV